MTVFAARAADDDKVHRVDADASALLDPSPFRTRCGRAVFEVYNTWTALTCPECAAAEDD